MCVPSLGFSFILMSRPMTWAPGNSLALSCWPHKAAEHPGEAELEGVCWTSTNTTWKSALVRAPFTRPGRAQGTSWREPQVSEVMRTCTASRNHQAHSCRSPETRVLLVLGGQSLGCWLGGAWCAMRSLLRVSSRSIFKPVHSRQLTAPLSANTTRFLGLCGSGGRARQEQKATWGDRPPGPA